MHFAILLCRLRIIYYNFVFHNRNYAAHQLRETNWADRLNTYFHFANQLACLSTQGCEQRNLYSIPGSSEHLKLHAM